MAPLCRPVLSCQCVVALAHPRPATGLIAGRQHKALPTVGRSGLHTALLSINRMNRSLVIDSENALDASDALGNMEEWIGAATIFIAS